mmetsp:Transcript_107389/g.333717  ORF Transcript_107389/g.333717 Transcript_107389/m.333717 type:complete len:530 (+) Transcript_107389:310-1899(+)
MTHCGAQRRLSSAVREARGRARRDPLPRAQGVPQGVALHLDPAERGRRRRLHRAGRGRRVRDQLGPHVRPPHDLERGPLPLTGLRGERGRAARVRARALHVLRASPGRGRARGGEVPQRRGARGPCAGGLAAGAVRAAVDHVLVLPPRHRLPRPPLGLLVQPLLRAAALRELHAGRHRHGLHHGGLLGGELLEGVRELALALGRGPPAAAAALLARPARAARERRPGGADGVPRLLHRVLLEAVRRGRVVARQLARLQWLDPDEVPTAVVREGLVLHLVLHLGEADRLLGLLGGLPLQALLLLALPARLPLLHVAHDVLLLVLLVLVRERDHLRPRGRRRAHLRLLQRGGGAAGARRRPAGRAVAGRGRLRRALPALALLRRRGALRPHELLADRHAGACPRVDSAAGRLGLERPAVSRIPIAAGASSSGWQGLPAVAAHEAHLQLRDQELRHCLRRKREGLLLDVRVVQQAAPLGQDALYGLLARSLCCGEEVERRPSGLPTLGGHLPGRQARGAGCRGPGGRSIPCA